MYNVHTTIYTSVFVAIKCVLVRSGPAELQQYQDEADAPGKHLRTRTVQLECIRGTLCSIESMIRAQTVEM